jgi:hypothetical protein
MPQNNLLDYLTIIEAAQQNQAADLDVLLVQADTGEKIGVAEAREKSVSVLDNMIKELSELRAELQKVPLSKLREKYSIEA